LCSATITYSSLKLVLHCASFLFELFILKLYTAAGWSGPENLNHVSDAIKKGRRAPMNEFEVFHDKGTNTWNVVGAGIERFVQMTNWQ
jgi:hypothetical protein